jgi:MerR family copper efflux transcriptional regulator
MAQLTIGQLAEQTGVARSTLRYYEEQGLIEPAGRTEAGYRVYTADARERLLFIQRTQRLGFSLSDIRAMLERREGRGEGSVASLAEQRYLEIERQLTELLVQRHEMGAFLRDLQGHDGAESGDAVRLYERLIERVCGHDPHTSGASETLAWLLDTTGCALAGADREGLIAPLAGRHIHVWRDAQGYRVLIPGREPEVRRALEAIAALEAECHAHSAPRLEETSEGFLFIAEGPEAFLFAQFFLALESTDFAAPA